MAKREHSGATTAPALYSIAQFCAENCISRSLYYQKLKDGTVPPIIKIGRKSVISVAAAEEWRRGLQAA